MTDAPETRRKAPDPQEASASQGVPDPQGVPTSQGTPDPTGPNPGAIRLEGVSKRYGDIVALDCVDLAFERGGATVLMGPSGGGKTTVLRILLGLEEPDAGTVIGTQGLRLSAVFQEDRLCENLSVMANVCLPHGRLRATEKRELWARVERLLAAVGLEGVADRPVHDLSGGMKRRVALLRAALADFDLIAFDEPLKGLDDATKRRTMGALAPLLDGKTVVWVTHDRDDLAFFDNPRVVEIPVP